ncbi:MAG: hypothetical protein WCG48_01955 [Candidatus Berkelbacteria bacterium]
MKLFINTTTENNFVALYDHEGQLILSLPLPSANSQTQELLGTIEKILLQCGSSKKELKHIFVNTEAVSYTGVRVGVTTANTLAMSLDIPISSLCDEVAPDRITQVVSGDNFIAPVPITYKNLPKITQSKTRI